MNALLVFAVALCAGVAVADVAHLDHKYAAIVKSSQDITPEGAFQYGFDTENGISVQASGNPAGEIQGGYRYTDKDGTPVEVTYVAGPNGYVAQGNVIPQIPAAILRSLEWIRTHPQKEQGPLRP